MQARIKPVVLLVAEAVTLAHFARIAALAKALDPDRYEVVVASDPRYASLEPGLEPVLQPLRSVPSAQFERALAKGEPLYDADTLESYVADDLALLDRIRPDLIVGDFRLSLAVSAPLRRIPYAAVVNAYWSPWADIDYPVPDLLMTRMLGLKLGQALFDRVRPLAFAVHSRPLNRVRRRHGLPSLGSDLRTVYTWGDYTLYADVPGLVPMRELPPNHRFLGAPLWSARVPLPEWWKDIPEDRPVVLLTLGSSGRADLLPLALDALAALPVTVIAASAGKIELADLPTNAFVADYLPLDQAVQRASVLVCNGGSLATYAALARGVPTLGLCSNMDQLLNMNAVAHLGAGLLLRAARVRREDIADAVKAMLDGPAYAEAAAEAGKGFALVDPVARFADFVAELTARPD